MCGLHLCIHPDPIIGKASIEKMTRKTQYRGPDHSSTQVVSLTDRSVHLGFNRLSLLDLSEKGHQPVQSACGNFTLIFNGEIYNHRILREQLAKQGIRFHSYSDAEVLLQWVIKHGIEGLNKLNGMFALIFVDQAKEEVLIARDSVGMKPLFYYHDDQQLLADSTLDGLFASGIKKELNSAVIPAYLQFRYAPKPQTFFKNTWELEPGHALRFKKNNSLEKIHWHQASPSLEETESLEIILKQSIRRHLQGDVPGGLFLSGGVDSTLLLALAQDEGIQLPCFTVHTGQFGTQDVFYAKEAAKKYGSIHLQLEFKAKELSNFDEFISHQDQPIADSAAWLTQLLAKETKQSVKFVLSGAGADELFVGYQRHAAFYNYLKHPNLMRSLIWMKKSLQWATNWAPQEQSRLALRFISSLERDPWHTYLNFVRLRFPFSLNSTPGSNQAIETWLQRALKFDSSNYLVSDILALSDRAAMREGLEVRLPYLDQEVKAYAQSLNLTQSLEKGRKSALTELLIKKGGQQFCERSKQGFGLPLGGWMRQGLLSQAFQLLQNPESLVFEYLPFKFVQDILWRHQSGKEDFTAEIFSLLVLTHWLKQQGFE